MTKYTTRLMALALLSLMARPLQAQPMGGPPMGGPMGDMKHGDSPAIMLRMVLKQANLTPEQHDQVRKIMEADHQSLHALFTQLQAANNQLSDKLFAPGTTVQAADLVPQVQRVTQLRQQLMEQGVKTALAVRAVLTPQQLAKVAQLKDRMEKLQAEMRSLLEGNE